MATLWALLDLDLKSFKFATHRQPLLLVFPVLVGVQRRQTSECKGTMVARCAPHAPSMEDILLRVKEWCTQHYVGLTLPSSALWPTPPKASLLLHLGLALHRCGSLQDPV